MTTDDPRLEQMARIEALALDLLTTFDLWPLDSDRTREMRSVTNGILGQARVIAERIAQGLI